MYNKWSDTYYWGSSTQILLFGGLGQCAIEYANEFPDWGYIHSLSVAPDHRNRGWGKYLMKTAEEDIRNRNLNTAHLGVDKTSMWLVKWYESQGYSIYDEDNKYIYMTKTFSLTV